MHTHHREKKISFSLNDSYINIKKIWKNQENIQLYLKANSDSFVLVSHH